MRCEAPSMGDGSVPGAEVGVDQGEAPRAPSGCDVSGNRMHDDGRRDENRKVAELGPDLGTLGGAPRVAFVALVNPPDANSPADAS